MKKQLLVAAVAAAAGAVVNCMVGHIVSCAFKAVGLRCPCE
jgi:hypothetical protein